MGGLKGEDEDGKQKEMTAPDVSVGADTEQPIRKNTTSSISENGGNIKSFEELQKRNAVAIRPVLSPDNLHE